MREEKLRAVVRAREGPVFAGLAASVTSVNEAGVFDILPGHTNFISTIKSHVIVRPLPKGTAEERWEIEGDAVLRVYQGVVEVFLGLSRPAVAPAA